jgi:hypothetical protein
MEEKNKKAVEEYQCSGCISGSDVSCFSPNENGEVGCGKHHAGTMILGLGKVFLGMPKGFNRLGQHNELKLNIFEKFESSEERYDIFNIPAWKYLSKDGHTFVRGIMPRVNRPFLHVFLENCIDKINCLEITQKDLDKMD